MKNEVRHVFQVPDDKIRVIVNGVNPANFATRTIRVTRDQFAAPDERIVFYVGRLVREKGVQVLLDAAPQILARHPQTKFIIAGKGPYAEELHRQAANLGIAQRVYFTGYVDDEVRNTLYSWADVAVFPSLYEPFGIVALEGMAARTPVVVADTGGLSEIVEHGVDGLKFYPGNSRSLADMIVWLLQDRQLAQNLRQQAYRKVLEKFNWRDIALATRRVYQQVWNEYRHVPWYSPYMRSNRLFTRMSKIFARA
jgi:glycosyltransferase involved in cell wall biosynthesis